MDLTIFIAITSAAVVIQAGILVAMFFALRKTSSKMESLAEDIRTKILPTAEIVHYMLTDFRPKLESTMTNVTDISTSASRSNRAARCHHQRYDRSYSSADYPRR